MRRNDIALLVLDAKETLQTMWALSLKKDDLGAGPGETTFLRVASCIKE